MLGVEHGKQDLGSRTGNIDGDGDVGRMMQDIGTQGCGTQDFVHRKREAGSGTQDMGLMPWDVGHGTWDVKFILKFSASQNYLFDLIFLTYYLISLNLLTNVDRKIYFFKFNILLHSEPSCSININCQNTQSADRLTTQSQD